jgi:hypothetical protein
VGVVAGSESGSFLDELVIELFRAADHTTEQLLRDDMTQSGVPNHLPVLVDKLWHGNRTRRSTPHHESPRVLWRPLRNPGRFTMGSGIDVARESGDIVLLRNDLTCFVETIQTGPPNPWSHPAELRRNDWH